MKDISQFPSISHREIVTCEEAASERHVRIALELKTLLIRIGSRRIAVHLRGCDRLSRTAVRMYFPGRSLRLLRDSELKDFSLRSGEINPWNIGFCHNHAVCIRTQWNRYMTTNAGRRDTGIAFSTSHLLELPNLIVGNFSIEGQEKHEQHSSSGSYTHPL